MSAWADGRLRLANSSAGGILATNTWVENRALANMGGFSRGLALNGSGDAVLDSNVQSLVGNCSQACIGNTALLPQFIGADDFRFRPG